MTLTHFKPVRSLASRSSGGGNAAGSPNTKLGEIFCLPCVGVMWVYVGLCGSVRDSAGRPHSVRHLRSPGSRRNGCRTEHLSGALKLPRTRKHPLTSFNSELTGPRFLLLPCQDPLQDRPVKEALRDVRFNNYTENSELQAPVHCPKVPTKRKEQQWVFNFVLKSACLCLVPFAGALATRAVVDCRNLLREVGGREPVAVQAL